MAQLLFSPNPHSIGGRDACQFYSVRQFGATWPRTPDDFSSSRGENKSLDSLCYDNLESRFNAKIHLSSQTFNRRSPLGDSLDNFGNISGSTLAYKVPPELGQSWEQVRPAAEMNIGYYFTRNLFFFLNLRVSRVLDSWYQDALGHNFPFALNDININEPSLGYGFWQSERVDISLGRFPVHWGPSPYYGVTLSNSSPYHDGALLIFKGGRFRYSYFISSINPWLSGTPDRFTGIYPTGSEEYYQRISPGGQSGDFNSRNRIYDESVKTLIAHRTEFHIGLLDLGISELIMVGGKSPGLRDMNPFVILHNNFGDGYSSGGASADIVVRLPEAVTFTGELFLDEVHESDNGGNPSTFGWVFGLLHSQTVGGIELNHSLHFIKTDPFLYNHARPYLKLTNRHVIKSNFIQLGSDPFIDTYVIDYPLGYFRGADALDFWYNVLFIVPYDVRLISQVGWLKQGEKDSHSLYENNPVSSPSGEVEEEWRFRLSAAYTWNHWDFQGGYGFQSLASEDHLPEQDNFYHQVFGGVTWSFNPD